MNEDFDRKTQGERRSDTEEGNSEAPLRAGVEGEEREGERIEREVEGGSPGGQGDPDEEEGTEVAALKEELDALNDRHLRLAAEFENYRRRSQAEMQESSIRAQAELVGKLLDALDDLSRVQEVDPEETEVVGLLEGVELVARKLQGVLEESGVEMLDPEGEEFSPETMEAVMRVPAESSDEDGRVHQVFQRGCRFKGRLVRPARVSVQKSD